MADKTLTQSPAGMFEQQAAVVSCWLCGIRQDHDEMVPDGGSWCDDIRWYCLDARACADRWTTRPEAR